jgi:hypothetical protein
MRVALARRGASPSQYWSECWRWFRRRYWRLWPQVCILSVIAHILAVVVPIVARDYYDKPDVTFHANCLNRTALVFETLLVNNLTRVGTGICEGRIWFLMILVDFTVLTPLFVYALDVARRPMLLVCAAIFAASYAVRLGVYEPYFRVGTEHISSWLVGFALSEALFALQRAQAMSEALPQTSTKERVPPRALPPRSLILLAWFVVLGVGVGSVAVLSEAPSFRDLLLAYQYSYRVAVERLFVVPFCAAVAVLVYLCELQPTSYVARFLSHRAWVWPADLCYDAYLVGTPAGALGVWLLVDMAQPDFWRFVMSMPLQWLCAWAIAFVLNRGAALFRFVFERLAQCFIRH